MAGNSKRIPFSFFAQDLWDPKVLEALGFVRTLGSEVIGEYTVLLPDGWTVKRQEPNSSWYVFFDSDGRPRILYSRFMGIYVRS